MSGNGIDFGRDDTGRPIAWAAHRQSHWLDFAGNPNFSDAQRVVFVAYARHAANGHAVLSRGELAHYLVRRDGTLPDRRKLWRAIKDAVALRYLAEESQVLCLVIDHHDVQRGDGQKTVPCPRDHTKRPKANVADEQRRSFQNVAAERGRSKTNVGDEHRRSGANVGDERRRSVLSPLSRSVSTPQPNAEAAS